MHFPMPEDTTTLPHCIRNIIQLLKKKLFTFISIYLNSWVNKCAVSQGHTQGGGCWAAAPPPPNPKFKKDRFCRYCDIKVLRDLLFSRTQPLKLADD